MLSYSAFKHTNVSAIKALNFVCALVCPRTKGTGRAAEFIYFF